MKENLVPNQNTLALIVTVVAACFISTMALNAFPVITNVVETGGIAEPTDTIVAQWTGVTFTNGVANEPVLNKAANAPYTVGFFGEDVPTFVDRAHQWNGAAVDLPLP